MSRVTTLSEHEYEIVKLIRKANEGATHHVASGDLRRELEEIYHILTNLQPYSQNEEINEATRRIYNLLY